jgi:hemerythrin-like domain-containing protein
MKRRKGGKKRDALGMLDRSHVRLTERMDQLAAAVAAIAAGTATDDDRESLDEVMEYLNGPAARHVDDEEQSVFPRLAAHRGTAPLLKRLKAEHRNHDDTLAALRGAVRHLPAGAGTVATIAADLAAQYRDHIELEDAELIPMMRANLSADTLDEIRTEMRARRGK